MLGITEDLIVYGTSKKNPQPLKFIYVLGVLMDSCIQPF